MNEIPNTTSWMIAGYAVIFASLLGYALSIVIRWLKIRRDIRRLASSERSEKPLRDLR